MKTTLFNDKKNNTYIPILFIAALLILFSVMMLIYFKTNFAVKSIMTNDSDVEYKKEYAFITKESSDDFWNPVYKEMKDYGDKQGIYIQWMGKNITGEYTWEELMEIAREAGVDGVIAEADDSDECHYEINKTIRAGIPVITVRTDSQLSKRISYVGVSYYNLGSEYGNLILSSVQTIIDNEIKLLEETEEEIENIPINEVCEDVKVMVLMDKDTSDTSQNTILLAIQEQLNKSEALSEIIEVSPYLIDNSSDFSAEESVQNMLKEPDSADIIVCLNEINTVSVYQALVDQNKVGDTVIIGYSDSETVLKAIQKGIIYASINVDVAQLGKSCIEALDEFEKYGRVSDYYSVNFNVIDMTNVRKFIKEEVTNEVQ